MDEVQRSSEGERLPEFLRPLFWDTDFDRLRIPGHERYIIERILELGDAPDVRWMFQHFPRKQIVRTLKTTRALSQKSARFWAFILEVPPEEVRCLSESFRQQFRQIWPW